MITGVTPVNERIMRLRFSHTLGVISLVSLYTPTGVSEFTVKEFYAKLQMVVNSCCLRLTRPGSRACMGWPLSSHTDCSFRSRRPRYTESTGSGSTPITRSALRINLSIRFLSILQTFPPQQIRQYRQTPQMVEL